MDKVKEKVYITPDTPAVAGSAGTWMITYENGERLIERNGGIRIHPPITEIPFHWAMVRWKLGGVSVTTDSEAELVLSTPLIDHPVAEARIIEVKVKKGRIKRGGRIVIKIGDVSEGGPAAVVQDFAMKKVQFLVEVDFEGSGKYVRINDVPSLEVTAEEPITLQVIGRATPETGKYFDLLVTAEDRYYNVATGYTGKVELSCSDKRAKFKKSYLFKKKDNGVHRFKVMTDRSKIHRIRAVDEENVLIGKSNPIVPDFVSGWSIYFGDIHAHSTLSDSLGTPDEYYSYAKDVAGLDFASLTDHMDCLFAPYKWEKIKRVTDKYNKKGRFVTILGYEASSNKTGHKNIYFRDNRGEVSASFDDINKLFKYARSVGALVIPHQTNSYWHSPPNSQMWTDWKVYDEEVMRVVEICQTRGSFETDELSKYVLQGNHGASVQDGLALGYKLGFIGGTDNHRGQPGGPLGMDGIIPPSKKRRGLVAVYTKELSREAVFNALWNRRCYATSGERILLYFSINSHLMGEEFTTTTVPEIEAEAVGVRDIERMQLIKNNQIVFTRSGKSPYESFKYLDRDIKKGENSYYLRVIQKDDYLAWSSPIWVNFHC